jgi:hypothetical protein
MALLTAQNTSLSAGLQVTFSAVNASDTFTPDEFTFLYVKNTNAATRTITVTTTNTSVGAAALAVADVSVTIAATTGEQCIGPFPARYFADPTTGLATVTYSAQTNVTAALIRLTPVG